MSNEYEQNKIHKLIDELLKKEGLDKNSKYNIEDIQVAIQYNKKQFLLNKVI